MKISKKNLLSIAGIICLALYVWFVAFLSLDGIYNNFDVYPVLTGDKTSMAMHMRSIQENGLKGLFFNYRIGAPDGGTLLDTPGLDMLLAVGIYLIDLIFSPSTARLFYYTLIMTFVATALSMYYLLYKMKQKFLVNFTFSVLFALGPYHFYRYLNHVAIGNAFTVPFIFLIAFYLLDIISMDKKWEKVILGVSAFLLGIGCPYFTFFGLIIFAFAIIFLLINKIKILELVKKVWPVYFCVAGFILSRLPSFIYNLMNGANTECFVRYPMEQEVYGLKIIQLLLPVDYERIPFLSDLTWEYNETNFLINENSLASLGIIGTLCFLVLCVLLIYSFFNKEKKNTKDWLLIDFISITNIAFVLIGTIGGFGEIFNALVTAQIRCYNRVSIVMTCSCMIFAAVMIEKVCEKNKDLGSILCVLILGIGMFDQVQLNRVPDISNIESEANYAGFFETIESKSEEGAMVYQLPYMDYPETQPIFNLQNYKHFVGYLFTDNMKFSYGGIKGRDKRAKELFIDDGMSLRFLNGLIEAGFSQLYIDTTGYEDGGARIINFYDSMGLEKIISKDGTLISYIIQGLNVNENSKIEGYDAVFSLASICNIDVDDKTIIALAKGLYDNDEDTLNTLYEWYSKGIDIDNLQNNEYVKRLYADLLRRVPETDGNLFWLARLDEGASRQKVFEAFLKCQEYRKLYGIYVEKE